ncbi:MAG: hypothetical protein M3133_03390, partial [Actinomycetota bacterium]|nr:hypothetical protein [Actinomycetota bacterium]
MRRGTVDEQGPPLVDVALALADRLSPSKAVRVYAALSRSSADAAQRVRVEMYLREHGERFTTAALDDRDRFFADLALGGLGTSRSAPHAGQIGPARAMAPRVPRRLPRRGSRPGRARPRSEGSRRGPDPRLAGGTGAMGELRPRVGALGDQGTYGGRLSRDTQLAVRLALAPEAPEEGWAPLVATMASGDIRSAVVAVIASRFALDATVARALIAQLDPAWQWWVLRTAIGGLSSEITGDAVEGLVSDVLVGGREGRHAGLSAYFRTLTAEARPATALRVGRKLARHNISVWTAAIVSAGRLAPLPPAELDEVRETALVLASSARLARHGRRDAWAAAILLAGLLAVAPADEADELWPAMETALAEQSAELDAQLAAEVFRYLPERFRLSACELVLPDGFVDGAGRWSDDAAMWAWIAAELVDVFGADELEGVSAVTEERVDSSSARNELRAAIAVRYAGSVTRVAPCRGSAGACGHR